MARILVVDDDPLIQATLPLALVEHGHEVVQALDGKQALKEIRRGPIDLVIADVLMPEVDGLELLRSMQKEQFQVPLIAMSGGSSRLPGADVLQLARLLGARAVLSKPFTVDDLQAAVRTALGKQDGSPGPSE
jgi:DNA-binding response OmpR family regulator